MFRSVQVLRAAAVLMVIGYHVSGGAEGDNHLLAAGVDVFFAISGFVMATATEHKRPSFLNFMTARCARVVPLYWLATALMAGMVALSPAGAPHLTELAKALFFIPYYNPRNGLPCPILVPGWTLNYEMFFYLAFGLTLFLPRGRQFLALAALFVGLIVLRPFAGHWGAVGLRLTSPLLLEFLGGAVLAASLPALRRLVAKSGVSPQTAGLAAVAVAIGIAAIATAIGVGPHVPRTLGWGVPSLLLLAAVTLNEKAFASRRFGPLLLIGNASYAIYLFQTFPIELLQPVLRFTHPIANEAILFMAALGFGTACFYLLEWPLLTATRRLMTRLHVPPAAQAHVAADRIKV